MYRLKKFLVRIHQVYRLDPRALGLMRIAAGLLVISDLAIRAADLSAHYTDTGIWPVKLSQSLSAQAWSWSFHALSGSLYWEALLFALHVVLAALLVAGYKTRLSTFLLWLFTISLHNRNVYILQAGDDLLRLLLFWGLFLNWGECFSLDARKQTVHKSHRLAGSLGYLFLIASVYFFTANLKNSPEWRTEASALYYALSLDQMRLPPGDWLYQYPLVMQVLTRLVYAIEWLIPVLVLWPSKHGHTRVAACILILVLHLGIGLTLYVGLFFVINCVSAIGLLNSKLLNRFLPLKKEHAKRSFYTNAPGKKTRLVTNVFGFFTLGLCLAINLSSLPWFAFELKQGFAPLIQAARLDQYWGMFSPAIMKQDGWYVLYGIDEQGRQWDLKRNQDYVDFGKPPHLVNDYSSERWRKLAENMQSDNYSFLRPRYCNYQLRQWNKAHPEKKLVTLILYFMEEQTLPLYKTAPISKKTFCYCNDN